MKIWKRVTAAFLALTMLATTARDFPLSPIAQAEEPAGTAEEDTFDNSNSRRLFWRYDTGLVGNVISKNQFHVFAFAGDTICFGTNVYNALWDLEGNTKKNSTTYTDVNDEKWGTQLITSGTDAGNVSPDIVMIDLKGNYTGYNVIKKAGSVGLINNVAVENLAKNLTYDQAVSETGATSGGNTYKPYTYHVTETGVYTFEFRTGSGSTSRNITKTANWNQSLTGEVSAWNITVFDEYGEKKTGRTYLDFIALQTASDRQDNTETIDNYSVREQFYILTHDSYIYRMRFNNAAPYTFTFFSNNRGIIDSANGNILYKSVKALDNTWSSNYDSVFGVHGFTYKQPSSTDTDLSKTFKIFLEEPNPDLEGYVYTKARLPDPPTNIKFVTTLPNGNSGTYVGMGGYFSFDIKEATTATLRLEFKGDLGEYAPVEISDIVTPNSTNYFYWDGRDGNGKIIPVGEYDTYDFSYSVLTKSGEIHFPVMDMEYATGGITVTRISDIYNANGENLCEDKDSIYEKTKNVLYYDESDIYYGGKIGSSATKSESDTQVIYSTTTTNLWDDKLYHFKQKGNAKVTTTNTTGEIPDGYEKDNKTYTCDYTFEQILNAYKTAKTSAPSATTFTYSSTYPNGNSYSKTMSTDIWGVDEYNKDADGKPTYYFKYNNSEFDKPRTTSEGVTLRQGDHSHLSNKIDYSATTVTGEQQAIIDYLDSVKNPVGKSSSSGDRKSGNVITTGTTTDYAISNYWTFTPSTETSPVETERDNVNVYPRPTATTDGIFNLRAFTFYDENKNNVYDPLKGDHALPNVTFHVYKQLASGATYDDKNTYVINSSGTLTVLDSQAEFTKAQTDSKEIFVLQATASSNLAGNYTFPNLSYNTSTGTKYLLEVVSPDKYFQVTTQSTKPTRPSEYTFVASGTYGALVQEITVGGSGLKPDDDHNTIEMSDVGFWYDSDQNVTIEKVYNASGSDTIPSYTFFELSCTILRSDDTTGSSYSEVYNYWSMSAVDQYKHTYPYLPKEIDPKDTAITDKRKVQDYYISAEYYIVDDTLWKHVFNYDTTNSRYNSLLSEEIYYYKIEDTNEDGQKDYKDLKIEDSDGDGLPEFYTLEGMTKYEESSDKKPPFIATIDRNRGSAEITMTVTNSSAGGSIHITKVDEATLTESGTIGESTKYLEGATFRLYKGSLKDVQENESKSVSADADERAAAIQWLKDNQINTLTTRSNGQIVFTGLDLDVDTYTLKELYAPAGYSISEVYKEIMSAQIEAASNNYLKLVLSNYIFDGTLKLQKNLAGRGWINTTSKQDKFTFDISVESVEPSVSGGIDETEITKFKDIFNKETEDIILTADSEAVEGNTFARAKSSSIEDLFGGFNEAYSVKKVEFPGAGLYTFVIKENDIDSSNSLYKKSDGTLNVTKSSAEYKVEISVTEKEDSSSLTGNEKYTWSLNSVTRNLGATSTSVKSGILTFDNVYAVEDVHMNTSYKITKVLTGRDWIPTDHFTFKITGRDTPTNNAMQSGNVKFKDLLPDDYNIEEGYPSSYTVEIDDATPYHSVSIGEIDFDNIQFSSDSDNDGTPDDIVYLFDISEENGSIASVSYDTTTYTLKATLKSGALDNVIDELDLEVYKDYSDSGINTPLGKCVIKYNEEGKIQEENHATASHTFTFENKYTSKAEWNPIVEKVLNGRDWMSEDKFEFNIEWNKRSSQSSDAVQFSSASTVSISQSDKKSDGLYYKNTGVITFNQPGTYYFTIRETNNLDGTGMTKTSESIKFTVVATDDTKGKLNLKIYLGDHYTSTSLLTSYSTDVHFVFINNYSEDGTLSFSLRKTLEGRKWAEGDEFEFKIEADKRTKEAFNMDSPVIHVQFAPDETTPDPGEGGGLDPYDKNISFDKENGVITAKIVYSDEGDPIDYTIEKLLDRIIKFTAPTNLSGTDDPYKFTITETSGTDNIEYDTTKYEVTVTVTREISKTTPHLPTGNLLVQASYVVADPLGSGTKDASITLSFTNKAYVDQSLTVIKDLQDRNWADDDKLSASISLTSGNEDNVKLSDGKSIPTTLDFTSKNHEVTNTFRFYAPGTYTFTIKENADSAAGITYDANTYTWTVTVKDDGNGKLVATTNISDNKITITNTYSTETKFDISKEFTGRINNETGESDDHWLKDDKFTFTITADDETEKAFEDGQIFFTDLPEGADPNSSSQTVTISSGTDGHKVTIPLGFTNLKFTTDKKEYTFTLKITEDPPKAGLYEKDGITYDESVHTITFTVTENSTDKTYVIKPSTETITVTNTYSAKSVSAEFSLEKKLEGRPWNSTDLFTFDIKPTSGETLTSEVSGTGDHIGKFDLKFEKAGTYTYTITEQKSGTVESGINYDSDPTHKYTLTVVVEDNENGNLIIDSADVDGTPLTVSAQTTGADGYKYTFDSSNNLYFTNAYTAGSASMQSEDLYWIWVEKIISGREWKTGEQYKFTITAADGPTEQAVKDKKIQFISGNSNKDTSDSESRESVSVSTEDTKISDEYADSLRIYFENITFGPDKENTYTFDISEEFGESPKDGITYDNTIYRVQLRVTDNENSKGDPKPDGIVEVEVEQVTKINGSQTTVYSCDTNDDGNIILPFTNTYDSKGDWTFTISKTLTGRPWATGETFNFDLTLSNQPDASKMDAHSKENYKVTLPTSLSVAAPTSGETSDSGEYTVTFTEPGTYVFTLTEKTDTIEDQGITTTPSDGYTITVEVTDNMDGTLSAKVTKYNDTEVSEASFDNKFNFRNEYAADGKLTLSVEKLIEGRDWQTFDTFDFTIEPYGKTAYEVGNHVIMPDDKTATVKYDGTSNHKADFGDITFKSNGTVGTYDYQFEVFETVPEGAVDGVYQGLTYSKPYIVTVSVTDNGKGSLSAVVKSVAPAGSEPISTPSNTITFTNTYAASGTLDKIDVTKVLKGRNWLTGGESFSFDIQLVDKDGNSVTSAYVAVPSALTITSSTATENEKVKDSFGATSFVYAQDEYGTNSKQTYYFKISEVKPKDAEVNSDGEKVFKGVAYDDTKYIVEVEVTDDYKGKLTANIVSSTDIVFTNEYNAAAVWQPTVSKTFTGRQSGWLDTDSFAFEIAVSGDTGNTITNANQTVSVSKGTEANDTYRSDFEKITFTKPGTFTFTVNEAQPTAADGYEVKENSDGKNVFKGITYDDTVYTLKVEVTDNFDGTLSYTVTKDGAAFTANGEDTQLKFTNVYNAYGEWTPKVMKQLTGRDWLKAGDIKGESPLDEDESYEFSVKLAGTPDKSVTLPANLTVDTPNIPVPFNEPVKFTQPNTFTFTVQEEKPADITDNVFEGIAYSEKIYTVTATVTDNNDGTLTIDTSAVDEANKKAIEPYTFVNSYTAKGTLTKAISISKTLRDRIWHKTESFTFDIVPADKDAKAAVDGGMITLPEVGAEIFGDDDLGNPQTGYANEISFLKDEDHKLQDGTYSFIISETVPAGAADVDGKKVYLGISYDLSQYKVDITVTDLHNGNIKAEVTSITKVGGTGEPAEIAFVNDYDPSGVWPPVISKTIDGREWLYDYENINGKKITDKFNFTVELADEQADGIDKNNVDFNNNNLSVDKKTVDKDDNPTYDDITKSVTGQFEDITFTKDGVYRFVVKETGTDENGMTLSKVVYTMDVTVKDNEKGLLTPVDFKVTDDSGNPVTYNEKNPLSFVNTYRATTELSGITVSKTLNGRNWLKTGNTFGSGKVSKNESFDFTLSLAEGHTANNAEYIIELPKNISVIGTTDGTSYTETFDNVKFHSNGKEVNDYAIEVSEVIPDGITPVDGKYVQNGLTYDSKKYTVDLTVKDDFLGNLTVEVDNEDVFNGLSFKNVYNSQGIISGITVNKTLEGRQWSDKDKFNFELSVSNQPDGSSVSFDNNGVKEAVGKLTITKGTDVSDTYSGVFGNITVDEPGDYEFTLKEVGNPSGGILYDKTTCTITAKAVDNNDGTITITEVNGSDDLSFTNKAYVDSQLTVIKALRGRAWSDTDSFTANLTLTKDGSSTDDVKLITPSGETDVPSSLTFTKTAPSTQLPLRFYQPGIYTFTVQETAGSAAGLTYDGSVHTWTVTVDDNDGQLEITDSTVDGKNGALSADAISIVNTYKYSDKITISKDFIGRAGNNWLNTDKFTFDVKADKDTEKYFTSGVLAFDGRYAKGVSSAEAVISAADSAKSVDIPLDITNLDFTSADSYNFTLLVSEQSTPDNGIAYSKAVYKVTFTVTENSDKTYNVTKGISVSENADDNYVTADDIVFENIYMTKPVTAFINIYKQLTGASWDDLKDSFVFTADPSEDNPESGALVTDGTINAQSDKIPTADTLRKGNMSVEFTEAGEYEFTIKEQPGSNDGILYDNKHTYQLVVKVEDNDSGNLAITSLTIDGKEYISGADGVINSVSVTDEDVFFTNGYHAEAELSGITAVKLLKGRDWKNSNESFSFTIAPADDYTENEAGKTVIIPDPASANEDNGGKALFDALKFVSDGKETHIYKFTVSEIVPDGVINRTDKGLTYSDKTYDVYVKVTDQFNGHMTAEFVDEDGNPLTDQQLSLDFTNEYVSSGKWSFSVTENFIGRPWISADVFNYDIAVETEVPDGLTVTVPDSMHISMPAPSNTAGIAVASAVKTRYSADYAADFDKSAQYSFTKPGEYTFTITQKKDFRSKQLSDYGISFDDTVYEVTVQVTDDNEGKLNAEITKLLIDGKPVDDIDAYGDSFAFTNTYSATTTWNMSVEKQIDGREWKNSKDYPDSPDDFEFTIEAYGDETIQAVEDGTITVANGKTNITAQTPIHTSSFGNITFNSNGAVGSVNYSFIIREITPADTKGLTYSKPYIVTFEVTDDGEGTLTAIVTDVLQEGTKQKGDYTVNGNSVTVTFTNTYAASGSLSENSISAAKVLTGREWLGIEGVFTDSFTFALKPDLEDAITAGAFRSGVIKLNGDKVTVTDETSEHKDYFGSIDFKSNGQKTTVYTFKLSEIIPEGYEKEYSIDYDDAVFTVEVEVTDNYDGTLSAKVISGADAEFTNAYTASGVWPPVVNKVIDGREWLNDDQFTFKIALDEKNSDYPVVITNNTLTIGKGDLDKTTGLYTKQFEDIIFSKPGNYFFTVSEEKGQAGGLTYSDTEYYMYVRVVDEENKGTLVPYIYFAIPQNSVPEITGGEVGIEKALPFVNKYSATATLEEIEVSKKLTGRDWLKQGDTTGKTVLTEDESYKFSITAADTDTSAAVNRKDIILPADISISGISDGEIYRALFDGIIFNSNGNSTNTYTFRISEKIPADKEKLGGVEYDKSVYTVKVTVTDDFKGKLTLNAEIPDNILFTNKYTSSGTIEKGEIEVSKTLTGRPWQADDKFEFEIKNTVKPANSTVTIADEGKLIIAKGADIVDTFTGAFGDITFNKPGEYEFEIREINDGEPSGIDYDDTVYTVKVSVSDNYDGTLTAVVTGADNVSFTNKYHAEVASAEISFTKKVTGRHWEKGEAFAFKLEAADTLTQQAIDSGLVILPDNAETTLTGDGIKDEMTSAFGAIKFNSDGESETTYKFKITEEKGTRGGLTYDETVYTVTAVVKDDFKGKLTAELSGAENILFTNTYAAAGSLADNAISASKVLTGREWLDNDLVKDGFTFVIQPYGDTVNAVGTTVFMPENTLITVTDKNDPKAFFEKIDFKSDGERTAEYKFKVTEQNTQASGIDYDKSEYIITVTVSDDYNGALTAEVTDISKDGEPAESIVFTNDYSAYGTWPPVVDKVIDGRKWLDSDSFTFKITLTYEEVENSVNMPNDNTVDVTLSDNKDGKYAAQFDDITFTKPGLYIFEVSEEEGETSGLTYDTTVYEMYVDVSDDGMGRLTPKVVRALDQQGNDFDYGHINSLTFTNKYNAVGTLEAGGITVSKLLDGREWLDSDSFKFTIAPAEDYGSDVEIAENSITISGTDSEKTASFGNITFRKAGAYSFNISEASGDIPNITYDTSVYTVTVEATDNYDGTLTVNVTGSSAFTFTNTFVPDETSSEETAPPSEESTTPPEEITSDETTTPPEEITSDETTTPPEETTSDEVTTPPEETTPPPVTTTDNNRVDGEDDENNKPDDNVNTGTPLDAGAFAAASVLLAALIPTFNRRKNKKSK